MTKREREQVVELLRCAADDHCNASVIYGGIGSALSGLNGGDVNATMYALALRAFDASRGGYWEDYGDTCLEAAARVEEGSWP